jgi:hypothetical protein
MTEGPWSAEQLAPETVAAVREALGPLVEEIINAIRVENAIYSDVLSGPEGIGIRLGIERAIDSFLEAFERGERPGAETGEVWRRLGEAEFQAGRSLDALRVAFRTGTRAAWRGAAQLAGRAGVDTPAVIALAEAIFVYSDELAADVVEGYLRIQSDEAGERERRRRRLATLLLDPDRPDPEAIGHAAALARWPMPRTLALLVLEADGEVPREALRRLGDDVLVGADADGAYLVLPDPDGPGRQGALGRALAGAPAALGPTVEPAEAHRSLRWARLTRSLMRRHALPAGSPTATFDQLSTIILLQDEALAQAYVQTRLEALDRLPELDRERLLQTLSAWLAHQRHTPGVAAELHVHPQTVRYRIGKLRELLGDTLEDPAKRFELELALRVRERLPRSG